MKPNPFTMNATGERKGRAGFVRRSASGRRNVDLAGEKCLVKDFPPTLTLLQEQHLRTPVTLFIFILVFNDNNWKVNEHLKLTN